MISGAPISAAPISARRRLKPAGGGGTATTLDVTPAAVTLAGAANFLLAANASPGAAAVAGSAGFALTADASPAAVTLAGSAAFGVALDAAAGSAAVAGSADFAAALNASPAALLVAGDIDLAQSGVIVLNVEPAVVTLAGAAAFGLGLGVTPAAVSIAGGSAFGIGLAATPGAVVVAGAIELVWSEFVGAALPGGTFRRRGADLARAFKRVGRDAARVFRGFPRMADTIQRTTLVKDAGETVSHLFDFTAFPEYVAGETLSSPSVPAVSGLTIGTPAVTTEERDFVAAGGGVAVTISGGTGGTEYDLECFCTFSGGAVRVVKGKLVVEA